MQRLPECKETVVVGQSASISRSQRDCLALLLSPDEGHGFLLMQNVQQVSALGVLEMVGFVMFCPV